MRLPRGFTGAEMIRRLEKLGYRVSRQSGSHDVSREELLQRLFG